MSVIALDAGHGGRDPGALGRSGVREADINLAVARLAAEALDQAGARVVLTREGSAALAPDHLQGETWTAADLQARCDIANRAQADAFISIHCNAGRGWGTESWVFPGHAPSRSLAEHVQPRLVAALATRDRGIKEETFYVLQHTSMPAVLVELGFIDQPQEERLLTDPEAQRRAAAAIAAGALAFVGAAGQEAGTPIMGAAQVGPEAAVSILRGHHPQFDAGLTERIVAAYWSIALRYGIRPEVAFSQARKETADFRFGGLVQPWQNNWCGLGATGTPATGKEDLRGADPAAVRYQEGIHGAIFATPEIGVEAHVQHLYAYATTQPLPAGTRLVDPRFALVARGSAPAVEALSGRWSPEADYGQSIVRDYLRPLLAASPQTEVAALRAEIETLRRQIAGLEAKVARAAAALSGEGGR